MHGEKGADSWELKWTLRDAENPIAMGDPVIIKFWLRGSFLHGKVGYNNGFTSRKKSLPKLNATVCARTVLPTFKI